MEINSELITKYISGNAGFEEKKTVEDWILSSPMNRREFERLQTIWYASGLAEEATASEAESAWDTIERIIDESPNKGTNVLEINRRRRKLYIIPVLKYAATIILTLGITWLFFSIKHRADINTTAVIMYQEVTAPLGSRSKVKLSDGSEVWLNSGSSLKYSTTFNKTDRQVSLVGEGYFKVAHNSKKPFIVKTNGLDIKVLGTEFNVKAYPGEKTVQTTVVRGLVRLIPTQKAAATVKETLLNTNNKAIYTLGSEDMEMMNNPVKNEPKQIPQIEVKQDANPEVEVSWKDGRLILEGEPLEGLVTKLERRYDVKITIYDEDLKLIKYNGTILDESLEQVLNAIKITSGIDYSIKHKDVGLYKHKK